MGSWRGTIETLELRSLLAATGYLQLNLVSDQAGAALVQDPQLINPAGIALAPSIGDFWVSDTGTGVSTLYAGNVAGSPFSKDTLTVTVPGGAPTGQVFNSAAAFNVTSGGASGLATFIFASRSGQISGWNPSVPAAGSSQAETAATVSGAIFTGLAEGTSGGNPFLYAADFHNGRIDVFNGSFATATLAGSFADAAIPAGFAPFNIQDLNGNLFVTYAKQDAAAQNAVAGAGNGFVAEFDSSGNLIGTLVSNGPLNAPWGLALAPATFGDLAGDLLVANSGDGKINAFNPTTGAFISTLNDASGNAITIDGLRGLSFGNGTSAGDASTLYFSAGPSGGTHGLFGSLQSAQNPIDVVATTLAATEGAAFSGVVATFNST
ncbi:MAG TPA: TIGR03118 family protein, partial [Pirellulales bacterium]|nr:TIGR03118 family protein [Pirellulales bacterium]